MFFLYGWMIEKLQGIILHFLEKKIKITGKTKTRYYTTSILCNALENYLYI